MQVSGHILLDAIDLDYVTLWIYEECATAHAHGYQNCKHLLPKYKEQILPARQLFKDATTRQLIIEYNILNVSPGVHLTGN